MSASDDREIRNALGLPESDQLCIVVRSLKEMAAYYSEVLGIGP